MSDKTDPDMVFEAIELSEPTGHSPHIDDLPRMIEPPPVRLLTVENAKLLAGAGLERQLDAFYVELLQLVRDPDAPLAYQAANFSLVFEIVEPPVQRLDMRAIGIEVQSLAQTRSKLIDAEIEHVLQRGIMPGQTSVLLQDPAGNFIELSETAMIR